MADTASPTTAPRDLRGRSIATFVAGEIASDLEGVARGEVVETLIDDETSLRRDLDAWAAAAGHDLSQHRVEDGAVRVETRKGAPPKTRRALAMVVSDPGLEQLLSPLAFALAAALEGHAVSLYFQGPAVRVLRTGFTPRLGGWARPFSAFARRGMERTGHVHPHEKLRQLERLGAVIYICGGSMAHFGVRQADLAFPRAIPAQYLTFVGVMAAADVTVFVQ